MIPNPFAVGGGDLDPLGRSDGGMLVNPRSIQPGYSGPGSLPIGAVPPGIFLIFTSSNQSKGVQSNLFS